MQDVVTLPCAQGIHSRCEDGPGPSSRTNIDRPTRDAMPTSTRRQAASHGQRYSEVSVGALSMDLAEEDDRQDVHEGQGDDQDIAPDFDDEVTIEDGEAEHNEDFGANGTTGEQTLQHERHLLIYLQMKNLRSPSRSHRQASKRSPRLLPGQ